MDSPLPRRLFHAVVLIGASLGAGCDSPRPLPKEGGPDASVTSDAADVQTAPDRIALDISIFLPDGTGVADASDAACDVTCASPNYYLQNCQCVVGIL